MFYFISLRFAKTAKINIKDGNINIKPMTDKTPSVKYNKQSDEITNENVAANNNFNHNCLIFASLYSVLFTLLPLCTLKIRTLSDSFLFL